MITFFIRLGIILSIFFCTVIFSFSFNVNPLILACVLVCSWLTIVPFEYNYWWIFTFSIVFGFLYYDIFGLFTLSILLVGFLFHLTYVRIVRSTKDNLIISYIIALLLSTVIMIILEIIIQHYIFFDLYTFIINIVITFILFFAFQFGINLVENFINFYTHGTDIRCHT